MNRRLRTSNRRTAHREASAGRTRRKSDLLAAIGWHQAVPASRGTAPPPEQAGALACSSYLHEPFGSSRHMSSRTQNAAMHPRSQCSRAPGPQRTPSGQSGKATPRQLDCSEHEPGSVSFHTSWIFPRQANAEDRSQNPRSMKPIAASTNTACQQRSAHPPCAPPEEAACPSAPPPASTPTPTNATAPLHPSSSP